MTRPQRRGDRELVEWVEMLRPVDDPDPGRRRLVLAFTGTVRELVPYLRAVARLG